MIRTPAKLLLTVLLAAGWAAAALAVDEAGLRAGLASEDAAVRTAILEEAAGQGSSGFKLLRGYLEAAENPHRAEAAAALGRSGGEKALPVLRDLLRDPDQEVRLAAARAIGEVPGKFVAKALASEIDRAKGELERELILSLGRQGSEESSKVLQQLLGQTRSESRRLAAVEALGYLPREQALNDLLTTIKDSDPAVRRASVAALARLGDPATVHTLVAMLEDPDPETADLAAQALSRMGEPGVRALVGTVRAMKGAVRLTAARLLAEIGARSAAGDLAAALGEVDPELRLELVTILGRLGGPEQVPQLVAVAADPDPAIRLAAMTSLIAIQGETAAPLVEGALTDSDETIRHTALQKLVELRGGLAVTGLGALMVGEDADMAARAEQAIRDLGGEAVPEVVQLSNSPDERLRLKAIGLLGASGDARAAEPLLRQLRSVDARYRDAAVKALIPLAPLEAKEPLEKLLKRRISDEVRRDAQAALAAIRARHGG